MDRGDEIDAADRRGRRQRADGPVARAARYDRSRGRVVVSLDDGLELTFPAASAEGLAGASESDLSEIEITPSGLGLHWPRLDADLYLPGLLKGVLGSRRWMAAQIGAAGGAARSPAKAAAARANGRLGGRPRKAGGHGRA